MDKVDSLNESGSLELIRGSIPPKVLMIARSQGMTTDDIWGVYLPPDDNRNPNMGSHYLGMAIITPEEAGNRIRKERDMISSWNVEGKWQQTLDSLMTADSKELNKFSDTGLAIINEHEGTHKKQYDAYRYQTYILLGYKKMNETADYGKKTEIRINYQDLILLSEIQALGAQCSLETVDKNDSKTFNVYWFSKTFKLFNETVTKKNIPVVKSIDPVTGKLDIDYIDKNISWLEDLYNSLRNGLDYDSKIINVGGLLSRALYLCDNPVEMLHEIRDGSVTYQKFEEQVYSGLQKIIDGEPYELVTKGKQTVKLTENPIKDKVVELAALIKE